MWATLEHWRRLPKVSHFFAALIHRYTGAGPGAGGGGHGI